MPKYQYKDDSYHLSPLWDGILDIYTVYRKICEKHHLRHFVIGGTLLGAMRHGGFIPWDDDFDVGMPRPDYEKLKEIIASELPSHLKFVNYENSEFALCFGKIQDCREEEVLAIEKKVGYMLSNGVYLDVFPIDGRSTSRLKTLTQQFLLRILAALERFHCHGFSEQSSRGKIGWIMGMAFAPFFPLHRSHKKILALYERIMRSVPYSEDTPSLLVGQGLNVFIHYPKNAWVNARTAPFESSNVSIPGDAENLLRVQYGDYMKLPPESARHPSHGYTWRCSWCFGPTSE